MTSRNTPKCILGVVGSNLEHHGRATLFYPTLRHPVGQLSRLDSQRNSDSPE